MAREGRHVRVGVDLVEVETVRRRFARHPDLLRATFSDGELDYCLSRRDPWPHVAARFAAKEALLKALGTGLAGAMSWRDIEVVRDAGGAPALRLDAAVAARAARQAARDVTISLSHTRSRAIAVVVLSVS